MSQPERRSMCLKDWLQLGVWVVLALGAYYGGRLEESDRRAIMETRMSVAETRILQETKGYETLLVSFNERMTKMEAKIDRLIERGR